MGKFVPKEKMGKKARKLAAAEKRMTLAFSPVTRKINSKKINNRKLLPFTHSALPESQGDHPKNKRNGVENAA